MIDILIFSKDRACQLDLLLTSIIDNFSEANRVTIVCKTTTEKYMDGYMKLFGKYPQFSWVPESNLIEDIRSEINFSKTEYIMTMVDDEIVIRKDSVKPLLDNYTEEIHCASLRMGKNIGDYCYTADLKCDIPELEKKGEVYKWDWTKGDGRTDWYYPACINSHIYRTGFLMEQMYKIQGGNVNDMEGVLNLNRVNFKHYMLCLENSKTINIANNLTQTGYNRHSNNKDFSLEELNSKFLQGYVIDKNDFYKIKNDNATFEKDYNLIEL